MDDRAGAVQVLERGGEVEVGGSAVDRVRFQNEQPVDGAFVHRRHQVGQGGVARTAGVRRLVVGHRGADVAERRVQCVDRRVDLRRLAVARDDQAGAAVIDQILRDRLHPGVVDVGGRNAAVKRQFQAVCGDGVSQLGHEGGDTAALYPQPVVRVGGRDRVDAVDGVVPEHLRGAVVAHTPGPGVAAQVADAVALRAEEVGVQGEQDLRRIQVEESVEVIAGRRFETAVGVFVAHRLPGHPAGLGIAFEQSRLEPEQSRRRGRLGEHRQPGAVGGGRQVALGPGGDEVVPGRRLVTEPHRLGAVRVVQVEDGGLRPDSRCTTGKRVEFVPLDLGRPALVALQDQPEGPVAERHRGGVGQRNARDHAFRSVDVGNDVLDRTADDVAAGQAGQGGGGAQHREDAAPAEAVLEQCGRGLGRALGELPVQELGGPGVALYLFQAPPIRLVRLAPVACAHRWHPVQSSGGARPRSAIACSAKAL